MGEEAQTDAVAEADGLDEDEAPEKLNLAIDVQKPSACERHITVTVSREDIDRYYDKAFSDLMESASVPGFRPGRRRASWWNIDTARTYPIRSAARCSWTA